MDPFGRSRLGSVNGWNGWFLKHPLSSFYTRRWNFPIRDRTRDRRQEKPPPLELPFVGLEIARAHHLLDSFLRCSMVLVRGIGTGIRPFSAYRDWVPISFDRYVEVWIVGSFMRKDEERSGTQQMNGRNPSLFIQKRLHHKLTHDSQSRLPAGHPNHLARREQRILTSCGDPECTGFKDSITERRRGYSQ